MGFMWKSYKFYHFPNLPILNENPEHFPVPTDLKNSVITDKLDGSLLIVSKYKGNYILRTRGTVDATRLENGYELEIFKQKYLPLLEETNYNSGDLILGIPPIFLNGSLHQKTTRLLLNMTMYLIGF
jgi:hypothetical protein